MNKMKTARFFGPYDNRVVEIPIPDLKPREVFCRVVRSGICGTDYSIYTGECSLEM